MVICFLQEDIILAVVVHSISICFHYKKVQSLFFSTTNVWVTFPKQILSQMFIIFLLFSLHGSQALLKCRKINPDLRDVIKDKGIMNQCEACPNVCVFKEKRSQAQVLVEGKYY